MSRLSRLGCQGGLAVRQRSRPRRPGPRPAAAASTGNEHPGGGWSGGGGQGDPGPQIKGQPQKTEIPRLDNAPGPAAAGSERSGRESRSTAGRRVTAGSERSGRESRSTAGRRVTADAGRRPPPVAEGPARSAVTAWSRSARPCRPAVVLTTNADTEPLYRECAPSIQIL
jgi:hypothetical protein